MQPIPSPWHGAFESFARTIRHNAVIVAPFITEQPLRRLAGVLAEEKRQPQISLLTNLAADSLLQGSVDGKAIADFCRTMPATTVRHLPGLHAKAYVADDHTAIITSGNLTAGSIYRNYEYGIRIDDPDLVRKITRDLLAYGDLGVSVSLAELDSLADTAKSLKDEYADTFNSARVSVRQELENRINVVQESLMQLRAKPGESTNAIFGRTILYILSDGPLATIDIHPLVQNIHTDLCDDSIDRVINGVHFGVRWKHLVRRAQQYLRDSGQIVLRDGKWHLVDDKQHRRTADV